MKKIYKSVRILMSFGLITSAMSMNAQASYCTPTWSGWAVNEPTEPITLVQFGTGTGAINNSSSNTVSAQTPRYEDFSSIVMDVQRGQTYTLKVKGNTDGNNTNYITVYFDWNGDGLFSNATPPDEDTQQEFEKHQHLPALINSTGSDDLEVIHQVTIPQTAALGSIRMRIVKNYNAPSNHPCENPFIFGQVEDYTLNITEGSILPEPQECSDPGLNPGDTGCVTFIYNNSTVTYGTVRGADGQIWLQQNLGSSQIATTSNDTSSYGDYYQWGRWTDGHQAQSSTITATPPSPNNPDGLNDGNNLFYSAGYNSTSNWWSAGISSDTWVAETVDDASSTNGCDPCRAMGQDWRLPTITEVEEMITAENLSDFSAEYAFNSNLKIPSAGIRDYGGFSSQGVRAYLWSSTPTQYTGSSNVFYSGLGVTVSGYVGRDNGVPIRCIKKLENTNACGPIATIDENFETFTAFPENCWTTNKTYPMIDLNINSTSGNHSISLYSFMSSSEPIYIVSPQLTSIQENQVLEFDIISVAQNAVGTNFTVGTMTDNLDFSTFTPVGNTINSTVGTHSSSVIPASNEQKYVALRFNPNGQHQTVSVDNIKLTSPTASNIEFNFSGIKVYPNPTTDVFFVETELEIKEIEVYNTLGQKVIKTDSKQISLQNHSNGIYLIKVKTIDGFEASYKIIKK